jgi:hypothetical protein
MGSLESINRARVLLRDRSRFMTKFGFQLRKRRAVGGFALAEAVVAAAIAVIALGGFYASTQQAGRVLRMGKEVVLASEMLQQRIEALRYAPQWTNVTTAAGIASIVAAPTGAAANFGNVTETYTVSGYPSGSALTVTRSPRGTFTNNGVDLSSISCVKLTVTATWTGIGNVQRSRQLSTIIFKGGL